MDIVTGVGVIDKAVHVLRAVADQPRTLNGLQAATGLPRATAHRLAVALEVHGLLRRTDDGRFDLGPELAALGRAAADRFPLAGLALPAMERLRADTDESVQLFVREGSHRRCVVSLQSPHALRWIVPEGVLFPLDVGSAGRVLTAGIADGLTAGIADGLTAGIADGWVESVEEREAGVASVSAPVCDAEGAVVAAVSVSGPIDRLTRAPGERFGSRVVGSASEISEALGTSVAL